MPKNTEHLEQSALISWFRTQYPLMSNCLWAIPNGGVRHIKTAMKLKKEGVLAGVSDLFLMIPKNEFHGLFLEMKAIGGKVQPNQVQFINLAKTMGYQAEVCFGFQDAKEKIQKYLRN